MNEQSNSKLKNIDFKLVFIFVLLGAASLIAIYTAQLNGQYNENFLFKQIFWFALGTILAIVILFFEVEAIERLSTVMYIVGNVVLGALVISPTSLAPTINGAKSWFVLPGLGSIQPSEFMKIILILYLSKVVKKHNETYNNESLKENIILVVKVIGYTLIPITLIMLQPDFGTSMVMFGAACFLLLVSGLKWRIIFYVFSSICIVIGSLIYTYFAFPVFFKENILKEYQLDRIYSWLDPFKYESGIGYQLKQSLLAIGTGGVVGKGFGNREVYIPESHSDFIFTNVAEQFGFLGGSTIIALFFLLIYKIISISLKQRGLFGKYVCVGFVGVLTIHVFENIGMVIGLVPITGIPLPFLSYGGSSLMANMIAFGFILNLSSQYNEYMFDK